jgi:predicted metal-dependent phosphoesterase TrpH
LTEKWLKVDFHTHSREDPKDNIAYDAHQLIRRASQLEFDALAITNHNSLTFDSELQKLASEYNLLLLPGAEITCEGKHVLVINPPFLPEKNELKLKDLASLSHPDSLIIAPHPYFPGFRSLFNQLDHYHELFDAVEFSAFYNRFFNPNEKAMEACEKYDLPLVAGSDAHNLWQLGTAFTLVAAVKTTEAIVEAVKKRRTKVVSYPLSWLRMLRVMANFLLADRLKIPWHI